MSVAPPRLQLAEDLAQAIISRVTGMVGEEATLGRAGAGQNSWLNIR